VTVSETDTVAERVTVPVSDTVTVTVTVLVNPNRIGGCGSDDVEGFDFGGVSGSTGT